MKNLNRDTEEFTEKSSSRIAIFARYSLNAFSKISVARNMYIILKIDLLTSLTTSTCSDFIQDSVSLLSVLVAFVPFLATFYVSRGNGHKGMAHVQSFRPRAAASMKSVPVTVLPRQLGVRHQQRATGQFYGGNQVNSTNLSRFTSSFLLGAESPALSAHGGLPVLSNSPR